MADLVGHTAAVGEDYLVLGKVAKKTGTKLLVAAGAGGGKGGKPFTVDEGETAHFATLFAAPRLAVTFILNEAGSGVTTATPLYHGEPLATVGDIVLPVACRAATVTVALWHSTSSAPTGWTLTMLQNGSAAATAGVTFGDEETWEYDVLTWGTEVDFSAGDRLRIELDGGDPADAVRGNVVVYLEPRT